jgi:hypothetical protein
VLPEQLTDGLWGELLYSNLIGRNSAPHTLRWLMGPAYYTISACFFFRDVTPWLVMSSAHFAFARFFAFLFFAICFFFAVSFLHFPFLLFFKISKSEQN